MRRDELAAWLRLSLSPQVGNLTARRLLAAFGLPQQVFAASTSALAAVAGRAPAQGLREPPPALAALVETTADWLAQAPGCRRVLTLADTDYPPPLLQLADPPLVLYALGEALAAPAAPTWDDGIAIVGSRNPTAQGALNARQFARSLAQAGWTVVSGLALGVDAAAHEGALEGAVAGRLPTLAVVGTGLDQVYPPRHLALAQRIARHGLVLSEYPLGTPPLKENFPRRNRLIAALGRGTLVVEAAPKSGSLITARNAAEQGREVFAIPGSIHAPQSRGCHALIRQGAKLVETAQDVLDELLPGGLSAAAAPAPAAPDASPQDPLLAALGFDPASLDALVARSGLGTAALQARLLELELQGEVARLPAGLFQRIVRA